ncbi:MAG: hypothetical protein H0W25_14420 [Acidimicrobiia bacterium]|nr:hypothetical protein [Acidimicrobiia bacterium]
MPGTRARRVAALVTIAALGAAGACRGGGAEEVSAEEWVQGFCDAYVELREEFDGPEARLAELEATGFDDQGDALAAVDRSVDALDELRGLYGELVDRITEQQPEGDAGAQLVADLRAARAETGGAFGAAIDAFRRVDRSDPAQVGAAFDLADDAPAPVAEAISDLPPDVQAILDVGCEG